MLILGESFSERFATGFEPEALRDYYPVAMLYFERRCLDLFPTNFARYLISFFLPYVSNLKPISNFSWSNFPFSSLSFPPVSVRRCYVRSYYILIILALVANAHRLSNLTALIYSSFTLGLAQDWSALTQSIEGSRSNVLHTGPLDASDGRVLSSAWIQTQTLFGTGADNQIVFQLFQSLFVMSCFLPIIYYAGLRCRCPMSRMRFDR